MDKVGAAILKSLESRGIVVEQEAARVSGLTSKTWSFTRSQDCKYGMKLREHQELHVWHQVAEVAKVAQHSKLQEPVGCTGIVKVRENPRYRTILTARLPSSQSNIAHPATAYISRKDSIISRQSSTSHHNIAVPYTLKHNIFWGKEQNVEKVQRTLHGHNREMKRMYIQQSAFPSLDHNGIYSYNENTKVSIFQVAKVN